MVVPVSRPRGSRRLGAGVVVQHLLGDKQGSSKSEYRLYQAIGVFKGPTIWLLLLYTFGINIPNGVLTSFEPHCDEGF